MPLAPAEKKAMRGSIADTLLIDSGFWLALFDTRDPYHNQAICLYPIIEKCHALLPWPILYEVISTRLVKSTDSLNRLYLELQTPGLHRVPDDPYRESALEQAITTANQSRRTSLVDAVLRKILADPGRRIDAMVTFNDRDFADVCARRRIPMYPRDQDWVTP